MKINVIQTYDKSRFTNELEDFYKNYDVDHIDTSTQIINMRQEEIVVYIAIVFYRNKVNNRILETKDKFNVSYKQLNIPTRVRNIIKQYNYRVENPETTNREFYDNKIETINDLIEAINTKKLYHMGGLGDKYINDTKEAIREFDEEV